MRASTPLLAESSVNNTIGWEMCYRWRYRETSRVKLKDMKESYIIEAYEYAVANKIIEESAFSWWDTISLKCRKQMINTIKS